MVGMEQKERRDLNRLDVEGGGVGGQPHVERLAACAAQKHFKLTTGELSVDRTLQRESLPATKTRSLNNLESNEKKSELLAHRKRAGYTQPGCKAV